MCEYNNIISTRIKELISERNVTQNEVAIEIGVSRQAISQYIDGSSIPNAYKLAKIALFFGVSADYLLGLDNSGLKTEKRVNCDITDNFLKELARMYSEHSTVSLRLDCINNYKNIIQEWSDEHPAKTRLDDLLEKYPDFHLDTDKYPIVLPRAFGYCDRYPSCNKCPLYSINGGYHNKCWDMPIENEKGNNL